MLNFSYKHFLKKVLKVQGKCSTVARNRSFRMKRILACLRSLLFPVFCYLSFHSFPISNFVHVPWSSVALGSNCYVSLQLELLLETAVNFRACCCSYFLVVVRWNWRWPLLGPDLEQSHETLQAQYILHSCRHCTWVILLLCCNKCLSNVHIAASVYNCQDVRSIIIRNTSFYTATTLNVYTRSLKESFCCCCPLKTTQN